MTDQPAPDAPEADVLEQQQPAEAEAADEEAPVITTGPEIGIDVPEADAIEQSQPVPLDEDDEPR